MIRESEYQKLFLALQELGAGEFAHLNGSLSDHLLGTERLLRDWGASEMICCAGLFHAAYGTAGYGAELVSLSLREQIAQRIGDEAEELVYLYCACDRDAFYPRIGSDQQNCFPNRFTGEECQLSLEQLRAICEITLANELELAANSEPFIKQYGDELRELFDRMIGLVSEAGLLAYQRILRPQAL